MTDSMACMGGGGAFVMNPKPYMPYNALGSKGPRRQIMEILSIIKITKISVFLKIGCLMHVMYISSLQLRIDQTLT
jgi:hypothetical protein